jgi:hypothetical protein
VCSFDGAVRLTSLDKRYWNVVYIRSPRARKAALSLAKTIHHSCFDDVDGEDSALDRSPKADDITGIFEFLPTQPHDSAVASV